MSASQKPSRFIQRRSIHYIFANTDQNITLSFHQHVELLNIKKKYSKVCLLLIIMGSSCSCWNEEKFDPKMSKFPPRTETNDISLVDEIQVEPPPTITVVFREPNGIMIGKPVNISAACGMFPSIAYSLVLYEGQRFLADYFIKDDPNPCFKTSENGIPKEYYVEDPSATLSPSKTYTLTVEKKLGNKANLHLSVISEDVNESRSRSYYAFT